MRTTIDIDDSMLAAAKERARERGISLGAAVSEMMRRGAEARTTVHGTGFTVFAAPPGASPVTSELVARFRDGDPSEQ